MFDLSLRVWKIVLNINLGREVEEDEDDEPPVVDTKLAASLGAPSIGFLRSEAPIDSE